MGTFNSKEKKKDPPVSKADIVIPKGTSSIEASRSTRSENTLNPSLSSIKSLLIKKDEVSLEEKRYRAAVVIQKHYRRRLQRKKYKKTVLLIILAQAIVKGRRARKNFKRLKHRTSVAKEILQTEKIYVKNLNILVEVYLNPLSESDIITKEDIRAIFSESLVAIYNFHEHFLASFEKTISQWSKYSMIGGLFIDVAVFFNIYSSYVNNFENSIKTLTQLTQTNLAFKQFLDKCCQRKEIGGMDLSSFLITPIQRIPRYVMLVSDLSKNTEENHPDYEQLKSALKTIKDTADNINKKKREHESGLEMVRIHDQVLTESNMPLSGLILPHRSFICEGKFNTWKEKDGVIAKGKLEKCIHLILFSDILLVTEPIIHNREPKLRLKIQLPIKNLSVAPVDDNTNIQNAFLLQVTHKTWNLICETDKDKKKWIASLEEHIQKDKERAATSPNTRKHSQKLNESASDHAKSMIEDKYKKL